MGVLPGGGFSFGHMLAVLALIFHGMSYLYSHGTGSILGPFPVHGQHEMDSLLISELPPPHYVHPIAFQVYCVIGVLISCATCALYAHELVLSDWGIIAGALYNMNMQLTIQASSWVGISTGCGVASASAIVSSAIIGRLLFEDAVLSGQMSFMALCLMVLGILGVCFSREMAFSLCQAGVHSPLSLVPWPTNPHFANASKAGKTLGLICGVLGGAFGGAMMAPQRLSGLSIFEFLPSFGLGAAFCSLSMLGSFYLAAPTWMRPEWSTDDLVGGTFTGIVWNTSLVFVLLAIDRVGYAFAFATFHCFAVVVMFWNHFLWNGNSPKVRFVYGGSAILVITGIATLALAAPGR
uniref:EamA domain-containing protein n=1 Tax=Chromera velia CCMP2878 TaxID=1169474 RepID=A0A0G4HAK6_9ALVE|eukprot:Cvel_6047.t1-p1 / transcript=Cvel_6047.t1 / gene=Cvel_6047 / organism=Chromera_velia_CCMP2878 / gene_product=hypothetical protein / transcript_product=hypothetical protein / location=Cvel_scaffold290:88233-93524(-) / protein_length=350 / sequence_SO=supercontig / SO=protein_coding / is_pseudo=false